MDVMDESEELMRPPVPTVPMEVETWYRDNRPSHPTGNHSDSTRRRHHPYHAQRQMHGARFAGPSSRTRTNYNRHAWKDHAICIMRGGVQQYQCIWRVDNVGTDRDQCGYTAKGPLVKRHIEGRHLLHK